MDISIFYFSIFSGRGKGESEAREGGVDFLLKIPGAGSPGRRGAEGPRGVCGELGNLGGGVKYFFRGRNVHQVVCRQGNFNSVHTRCIVKTSGFTRGVCKNRGLYLI